MERLGLEYRLVLTRDMDHGCQEAERAAREGQIPVVMSGDGLIGRVGGCLAGGETPLGIVPGGRGNDLARVLGIPTEPSEAVGVLASGAQRRLDVGEANGVRFLCIASCGFDSEANRIANEARWVRGPLVYAYAALRALVQWKPAHFRLDAGGEDHSFSGYSVAAANSRAYGGGMFVAPEAELDDGLLDVVTTSDVPKLRFLRGLPKVFKGEHIAEPEVGFFRAPEVRIDADRRFAVFADGEHITDLPVTIRLLPRSLSVIAPPTPI